jgi:hypothetical protein
MPWRPQALNYWMGNRAFASRQNEKRLYLDAPGLRPVIARRLTLEAYKTATPDFNRPLNYQQSGVC